MSKNVKPTELEFEFIKNTVGAAKTLSPEMKLGLLKSVIRFAMPHMEGPYLAMMEALKRHLETGATTAIVFVSEPGSSELVLSVVDAQSQEELADVLGILGADAIETRKAAEEQSK